MTILVIGEALVDVVHRPGRPPESHAGGSPFNVAVGLARLGARTALAAQMADDAHGAMLRRHLHASDVELVDLRPHPAQTSTATATIAPDGSASYHFDLTWDPERLPDPADFDAVHIGSLGTALEPGARVVAELVAAAHALGVPVSYDPNVRLTVEPDAAVWRRTFDVFAPHATVIKMSDEDAEVLFPGADPRDVVSRLAGSTALAAITRGGRGAVLGAGDRLVELDSPPVEVVDTIGAGDSFMAAMLASVAHGGWVTGRDLDLEGLGRYAGRAAAITCSRPGADPPRSAELT